MSRNRGKKGGDLAGLASTLKDAEAKQLSHMIKARSSELDKEINALRKKLSVPADIPSISSLPTAITANTTDLTIQGRNMNSIDITEQGNAGRSITYSNDEYQENVDEFSRDLSNFQRKIKHRVDSMGMTGEQVTDLLLPNDPTIPNLHNKLPINELTAAFQVDLALPLSVSEQKLLMKKYGDKSGEIDVKRMLKDANCFDRPKDKRTITLAADVARHRLNNNEDEFSGKNNNFFSDQLSLSKKNISELNDIHHLVVNESTKEDTEDLNYVSKIRLRNDPPVSITPMHEWIEENEAKEVKGDAPTLVRVNAGNEITDTKEQLYTMPAAETKAERKSEVLGMNTRHAAEVDKVAPKLTAPTQTDESLVSPAYVVSPTIPSATSTNRAGTIPSATTTNRAGDTDDILDDKMKMLAQENARLKAEMSVFDREFFEEIEDLKFRYTKLQELVGDAPAVSDGLEYIPIYSGGSSAPASTKPSGSKLPLDRLSWSVRQSMTAMDRAGITSQVAGQRIVARSANPYTYAPGGLHAGKMGNDGIDDANTLRNYSNSIKPEKNNRDYIDVNRSIPAGWGDISRSVDNDLVGRIPGTIPREKDSKPISHPNGATIRVGGKHGIGAGDHSLNNTHDSLGVGSFSNLCERRLCFEISNHPSPSQASRALIHRIIDLSKNRSKNIGYISVPQLHDALLSVSLKVSKEEVEVLASGFGSDGKGNIDAEEFCEMIHSLMYDYVGEHAVAEAKRHAHAMDITAARKEEDEVDKIMLDICESIIAHDKKAVLGASPSMFKALIGSFKDNDDNDSGILSFNLFVNASKDIGVMLSHEEFAIVGRRFKAKGPKADSALPSSNLDHITSFRDRVLDGSLQSAGTNNPKFGEYLSNQGIGFEGLGADANLFVEYTPFVNRLVDILETLMQKKGGLPLATSIAPWTLREFDLVDTLICQLEMMKPSERRRCLMSLQYSLAAADIKQEGDIDGFAVLNALLQAGFKLQRLNRVRLLRSIEDLGGKLEYGELCLVLLRSCADWKSEERNVVTKILKAMGMTVLERRAWIARLKQSLYSSAAEFQKKSNLAGLGVSVSAGNITDGSGIPPSAFLHSLRDSGVVLNVEEEATLLDCLDTERLAELGQVASGVKRDARGKRTHGAGADSYGVPLIYYNNFITFCSRFCGDWTDSSPETVSSLNAAIKSISNPLLALQEFASIIKSFDELDQGFISSRAFQISCHRARLMANFPESDIKRLVDVLSIDSGSGKIRYTPFLLHLRSLCSSINLDSVAPSIVEQLLSNAVDSQGALLPLRNWILRNVEPFIAQKHGLYVDNDGDEGNVGEKIYLLNRRQMNALLREFSIVYRPEDLEILQMQVTNMGSDSDGSSVGVDASNNKQGALIDARNIFKLLLESRGLWTTIYPELCEKMRKIMSIVGNDAYSAGSAASTLPDGGLSGAGKNKPQGNMAMSYPVGRKGIETVTARKILARLRAFSDVTPSPVATASMSNVALDENRMIEKDIFSSILRSSGVPLHDEDILLLCDATDVHPAANRVRCDVIIEALTRDAGIKTNTQRPSAKPVMSDAAVYAISHLKDLVWTVGGKLSRTNLEWIADVRAVFRGFDAGSTGYISSEDFALTLVLLNVPISVELLRDMPMVPDGPGLVAYKEILDIVLVPPTTSTGKKTTIGITNARSLSTKHDSDNSSAAAPKPVTTSTKGANKASYSANLAVKALCSVIRRSVYQFIVKDDTLEEAWVCLLKAFRRFDPNETDKVSPRDFCLAVSVLIDGDDVVMTKEEWIEVIDYYTSAKRNSSLPTQTTVDYMRFCENVLDPTEISQINPKDSALLQAAGRSRVAAVADQGSFTGLSGSGMNLSSRPQSSYASNRNIMTQGQRSREAAKADTRNRFTEGGSKFIAWQDGFGEEELVTMDGVAPVAIIRPESRIEKMAGAHTTSTSSSGKKFITSIMSQCSSEQKSQINALREDVVGNLKAVLAKSKSNKSMDALLEERLRAEDRNNSGNLSKQSLFAALHSLNVNPHAAACLSSGGSGAAKQGKTNGYLLEKLMKDDKVTISDFVHLIFYK